MSNEYSLRFANWPQGMAPLREVRTRVFIEEQNVPPEEEWDGIDDQCIHVLAVDAEERPIGTGRLLPDGKIGRMAVLKEWRGKGVGGAILRMLMEEARAQGFREVKLAAQLHALPFYEQFGFEAFGAEFMDAGIPHRWMKAALETQEDEHERT